MDDLDEIDGVEMLMQGKLLPYIVKYIPAAGFYTSEVISFMDTSENPGNTITIIESFIDKYYSGNKDFYLNSAMPMGQQPFCFPPGHCLRISNFVSKVKGKYKRELTGIKASRKHESKMSSGLCPRKINTSVKAKDSETDPESLDTIVSVSKQICVNIAKWARN